MEENNKEEDGTRVKGEEEVGVIDHTQHLEVRHWKKAMHVATPQSKLVPSLIVDDALFL